MAPPIDRQAMGPVGVDPGIVYAQEPEYAVIQIATTTETIEEKIVRGIVTVNSLYF